MKIIGKAAVAAAALTFLTAFAACNKEPAGPEKVVLSEVTHSVFYSPQYVAQGLGFFEDEGIELEVVNAQGSDKVMTAVISGQADIGLAGPEASIYVLNEGRDDHSVVFAQLTKRDGAFLVGREPESFSWDNLRGKYIISGRKGGVPAMTFDYVLRKNGIEPNVDATVDNTVQFALMAGAFTGGTGDYVTLFEPAASAVEAEGKGYILASVGEQSGEIPYTAYCTSKSLIKKDPELIQKFTNAIYRGQLWCMEHTADEIAEVIAPYFPDSDLTLLTTVTQRHKEIDAWNATPVMTEESLRNLEEVMRQAGELSGEVDFEKLVDNTFAEKAVKKYGKK